MRSVGMFALGAATKFAVGSRIIGAVPGLVTGAGIGWTTWGVASEQAKDLPEEQALEVADSPNSISDGQHKHEAAVV